MDARQESLDLIQNPLPQEIIPEPLAAIVVIEDQIAALQERLTALQDERAKYLDYAVKNGIREDSRAKLVEKTRVMRFLDVDKFKIVFPEKFDIICQNERADIQEKLKHVGEKIPLGVVDKIVNKNALAAAQGVISVQETISYQVVRK